MQHWVDVILLPRYSYIMEFLPAASKAKPTNNYFKGNSLNIQINLEFVLF